MSGNDASTKCLLHFEDTDGATTFADSAAGGGPHTFAAVGNAQIDTAQSKFGGSSLLLDGTGDYLTGDAHADFAFGTGDFVVDFWVRPNAIGALQIVYDSRPSGVNGDYPSFAILATGALFYNSPAGNITGTTVLSTGTWYHVAIVRGSGVTRLFLNGAQEGSNLTDGTNYLNGTSRPTVGCSGNTIGGSPTNGWIDELRVSKGTDRGWASGFTPPAAAYSAGQPRSYALIMG